MKRKCAKYLKQTIKVTGSDIEFILMLGARTRFYGNLEDRAINNMERWEITEMNACGSDPKRHMSNRFDFSVNEESDLRAVATFFIEQLGITDYCLDVTFS